MLKRILWAILLLSLIPGLILVVQRIGAEGATRYVTMVMDEEALARQAAAVGANPFELAQRYREAGLNGIVLYEDDLETAAAAGRIALMTGAEARLRALTLGEDIPDIPGVSTLITGLRPGVIDAILAKYSFEPREIQLGDQTWYLFPGQGELRPAGPNKAAVQRWSEAGWDIAYRPLNHPGLVNVGEDFPDTAHYLIHSGLEVAGQPNHLGELVEVSQNYITAIIEGTDQAGMAQIARKIPTARLLSFNQDYQNQQLRPGELVEKYLLAANERGISILYLRPYTEGHLGDIVVNTEALVSGLRSALEGSGYTVGPLRGLEIDYHPSPMLRALSAVGVAAALILLALLYPGWWGVLVAAAVLGLGVAAGGGLNWDAFALIAALAFPVLGYGYFSQRLTSLGLATLISLAGAILLAAVGSDQAAMLAISPFAGVGATLIVPPLLYLTHYLLRFRPPAALITEFWHYPIRLGHVALVFVGLAGLAVVFLRRGNFPIIGVSSIELALRDWLSDLFVRPRFKELLGHPMAVLALTNPKWADWLKGLLLTGGVIAQASILNSFSHYHTPLLISLQRTLIALALGLIIGLVLLPLARLAIALVRRWLRGSEASRA